MNVGKQQSNQLTATAYHEAGHAIVCHKLGFRVVRVTIVPTTSSVGHCTHENMLRRVHLEYGNYGRLRLEKTIMVCLAGQIAQRLWRPRSVRHYHSHSDFRQAADLALHINCSETAASAYLEWLSVRTKEIVGSSWRVIQAMATDLLEHGTITVKQPSLNQPITRRELEFFWR